MHSQFCNNPVTSQPIFKVISPPKRKPKFPKKTAYSIFYDIFTTLVHYPAKCKTFKNVRNCTEKMAAKSTATTEREFHRIH